MLIVAMAWIYVVLMMALAEAMAPNGTLLGAFFTLLLYGALPLSIVLYLMGAPARRRRRGQEDSSPLPPEDASADRRAADPDGGGVPPRDAVAAERKEA